MKTINIDIETFSSINISKSGVYKYVESEDFEVLLFAYSIDGGKTEIVDIANGEELSEEIIQALLDDNVIKWAFNAQFERICLSRFLKLTKGTYLNPKSWRCTMIWSAYMGLPFSLEGVGKVLGLEKQKLIEGKDLIKYFCVPCTPTKSNGFRNRNFPYHDKIKWEAFKTYNIRDVDTEKEIQCKLMKFPVHNFIWEEYNLDQEINDRGIKVDLDFVNRVIALDDKVRTKLMSELQILTELENPNSVVQLKGWLSEQGVETESLDKKSVKELVKVTKGEVSKALALRMQLSKSSIKKYQAMKDVACEDNRCKGMFQFLGANRTGRFSGRNVQLQNLPRNTMKELFEVRSIIKNRDGDILELLYDNVPDILSQLVRTAFVPKENMKFYVADFSSIEARVIAWLAGETWREELFKKGGDIYCMSASQMFGVPVVKHGINGELRQKGKIAELACIAEGEKVLTDVGLVPIEKVTIRMKLWDGFNFVKHDGVIYRGEREVITYDGLTATPDHLVWTEGTSKPIYFGESAQGKLHLLQTGDGGRAIRLGGDNQFRKKMESKEESLLCINKMFRMWKYTVETSRQSHKWKEQRLSTMFETTSNTIVVGQTINCSKTTLRKSKRQRIQKLWSKRDKVQVQHDIRSRKIFNRDLWSSIKRCRNRPNRQQRPLRKRKFKICYSCEEQSKQKKYGTKRIQSTILALCSIGGNKKIVKRNEQTGHNRGCKKSSREKTKVLEVNRGKTRVYDIRHAGPHNRFTVSNKLVHNCGYGGSVGALTAMGALDMGLKEDELKPLVLSWREANQNIVALWWGVDKAIKDAIVMKGMTKTHGIEFECRSGLLRITLPSGRKLTYIKPKIEINKFGGESVTYEGVGVAKKWERIESYGPKFVENIVQAISRDILMYALQNLSDYNIVAHVHDEIIIEAPENTRLEDICGTMSQAPYWAKGLILTADGYTCDFYMKD